MARANKRPTAASPASGAAPAAQQQPGGNAAMAEQALGGAVDVSAVTALSGAQDASRQMGAEAYAAGDQVAFQGAPDLHTAAHEAAHVVQQGGGRAG